VTPEHLGQMVGIGVDIGGTTTRVVAFDANSNPLAIDVAPTVRRPGPLLDDLAERITALVERVGGAPRTVGVGIPGSVRDGVVTMALNVGIDGPVPLADDLAARLEVPVWVENDVNAAALGAHQRLGAPRGVDRAGSLTYLSIGTGFAAGTVIDGEVVRGLMGAAGEIGHVAMPGRDDPCVCGQTGCIEAIASGSAVVARMRLAGVAGGVVELWDAADAGHVSAGVIRRDVVEALAWSSQLACLLLDVDLVVLGGGVGVALGPRLVDSVGDALRERERTSPFLAAVAIADRIRLTADGVEVGALGAHCAAVRALGATEVPA
jgi:glucokinase